MAAGWLSDANTEATHGIILVTSLLAVSPFLAAAAHAAATQFEKGRRTTRAGGRTAWLTGRCVRILVLPCRVAARLKQFYSASPEVLRSTGGQHHSSTSDCYMGATDMTKILTAEQVRKLVEWMEDRSVDTDVHSQERTYRKQLLDGLGETHVHEMAVRNGIVLSNEHLGVIECLRDYYLEFGEAEKGRDLEEMLDDIFSGHGGRKYLWHLFPGGPVSQGMRIAGLPMPPHTGDKGFGTVR
ncbi:MAG: TusE/DsrC/DsvC family sulfur relay protein [Gammaproteobacteria bacterium]|jgi:tRNA 2-thiouridine synthesizing protein E